MAIFGKETIGESGDDNAANFKVVFKHRLNEPGMVSSIIMRYATGASHPIRGLIYEDNNGEPGARKGVSTEVTLAVTGGAWAEMPFSPSVFLPPAIYWIGFIRSSTPPAGYSILFATLPGQRKYKAETYSANPSDPFGTPDATDGENATIYAVYEPVRTIATTISYGRGAI
jgi:hypothetical protein